MSTNKKSFWQQLKENIVKSNKEEEPDALDALMDGFMSGWTGKSKEERELQKRKRALEEMDEQRSQACRTTPPPLSKEEIIRSERNAAWKFLSPEEKARYRMQYINEPCKRAGLENAYGLENLLPEDI